MNNRVLLVVVMLLLPIAVISFMKNETNFDVDKNNNLNMNVTVRLKMSQTEEIVEITLEDYLVGVVAAEMPAVFHEEALKAQAVASRSFAISKLDDNKTYDLLDTTDSQAYISEEKMREKWGDDFALYYEKIKKSVQDTENIVLTYDKKIISAYFFAMSNGYTESAELVFNESKDYLRSVESTWDNENLRNYIVETKMPASEFCQKLAIDCNKLDIEIINRSNTNRINEIKINGNIWKGTDFRKNLGLRSTDFDIEVKNENIYITTRGYGHGVGMSQYGANGMANEGKSYIDILKHYYQNVEIIDYKSV